MYNFLATQKRIDWLYQKYGNHHAVTKDEFIKQVNIAYYKCSASSYKNRFIKDIETQYTNLIKKLDLKKKDNWLIVDIGAGTGFEYDQISKNGLKYRKYLYIEPDFEMINQFKTNHKEQNDKLSICQGEFKDYCYHLQSKTDKIIIINSCMHHLIELGDFLGELKHSMNQGDILIICHEPNNTYLRSAFYWLNYSIRSLFTNFLLTKLGIIKSKTNAKERWDNINKSLTDQEIITQNISPIGIRRIIDYGVNIKGDWASLNVPESHNEGFWTPEDLINYLGKELYETVYFSTYRHFGDSYGNIVLESLNSFSQKVLKRGGSIFSLALKRN